MAYDVPHGKQIPGSKYYRAYCARCGQPMRVQRRQRWVKNGDRIDHYCERCEPHKLDDLTAHLTPRQRHGLRKTR